MAARGNRHRRAYYPAPMRVAVVDMGTNSTRLLVADVEGGVVHEVERRSTVTRLGRGVDTSAQLSTEAIEDVCAAVGEYIDIYKELEVEQVIAIATSAVRDAENSAMFLAELRERFALERRDRRRRSRGSPHLPRRHRRPRAHRQHPRRRHRGRLDRARGWRRRRRRLLCVAAGRNCAPHRAPPHRRPANAGAAGGTRRRRARPGRRVARGGSARAGQDRDRRRRDADVTGRDRPAPRARTTPSASTATCCR